jgi:apolipoprotein N-acyltransferase
MKKYFLVGLSVTGGFFSGLAWTGWCSGLILLISFIPFFIIENYLYQNRAIYSPNAYFIYALPGFVIFSIVTLGWLRVASMVAAITVIIGMSFLMSFTVWLAHIVRLRAGSLSAVMAIISFWLCYEFFTLNFDLVTPWVNLGNGLAKDIKFIQWYEITGTSGGTLWILLSNITLSAVLIKADSVFKRNLILLIIWMMIIILPSVLSLIRYNNIREASGRESEIIIIQPNFDPYTTKFSTPFNKQLRKVISMAETVVSENTKWILTPETTVDDPVDENRYSRNIYINMLQDLAKKYPDAGIVAGMTTRKLYLVSSELKRESGIFTDSLSVCYDLFNSALKIDTSSSVEFYHKSKLVPGIEKQFSSGPAKIITRILPYLGGSHWGYGTQKERAVFNQSGTGVTIAPIICYESAFGKFVADYVKKGANMLFIITNDGWWKNTEGYKQHFALASLRAIETRRPVARCGNTGISAFIDIRGRVVSKTDWWTEATLKGTLAAETNITPYVRCGDWLLQIGTVSSLILIIIIFIGLPFLKKLFKH